MGDFIKKTIVLLIVCVIAFFTYKNLGSEGIANKVSGGLEGGSEVIGGVFGELNEVLAEKSQKSNVDSKGNKTNPTGQYDYLTFYESLGDAKEEKPVKDGEIIYGDLDSKGRATGVYGKVTREMYLKSKEEGRQPITDDPVGWTQNKEVTISYDDPVDSSNNKIYHGWFYNRSHLFADSLGGHPEMDNMVTGTRMQNVGWNDGNGGMAYLETKVRQFLKDPKNEKCSVYYSAVPNYYGKDDLIPQIVIVNAKSCDNIINERVAVYNVAPGYAIDYTNGRFAPAN